MSVIRTLAKLTIENIKKSQNWLTDESREQCLQHFAAIVNNPTSTDAEIISEANKQRSWAAQYGGFGIRGHAGSVFLRELDAFIHKGTYLTEHESDKSTGIKKLAELTIQDIKKLQNGSTHDSRITAINHFETRIKNENISDTDIIKFARLYQSAVQEHGKFGLFGPSGSEFLKKIRIFIQQATYLNKSEDIHPPIDSRRKKVGAPRPS